MRAIDGVLPAGGLGEPAVECSSELDANDVVTHNQAVEGYSFGLITPENLAHATVDPNGATPFHGCIYVEAGQLSKTLSLEPDQAIACMAEIEAHCAQ